MQNQLRSYDALAGEFLQNDSDRDITSCILYYVDRGAALL